jgi:hypothetical protein
MLAGEKFSITRAEARDYFEAKSDHAGRSAEWASSVIATSDAERTPPPDPELRRLWIDASCASHFTEQVRKCEEEWVSLFESSSELLIFHEEDVVRPLMETLGLNESLAGVLVRSVGENTEDVEAGQMPVGPNYGLKAKPLHSGREKGVAPLGKAAGSSVKSASVAEEKIRTSKPEAGGETTREKGIHRSVGDTTRERGIHRSVDDAEQLLVREKFSITRAEARDRFRKISDDVAAGSAWNKPVRASGGIEQVIDLPGSVPEVVTGADAHSFSSPDAIKDIGREANPSPRAVAPYRNGLANSGNPPMVSDTTPRFVGFDPAAPGAVAIDVRLDQILNRLAKRAIQSPLDSSRTKLASRELPDHSNRRSHTDQANVAPLIHPSAEVPLSGLQRLAQRAGNTRDQSAVESNRQARVEGGSRTPGNPEISEMLPVSSGEDTEFGFRLVEFLRSEVLRHGITLAGLEK